MHYPCPNSIISTLNHPADESTEARALHSVHSITALSILARRRSNKMKGLQLLVGLMLIARAVHKQLIASLNHLGISLSYNQIMEWVKRLARETAKDSNLKKGEWILVFDNVNFQRKVRHETKQRHTESWDFTSRLAVKVGWLPPPELNCRGRWTTRFKRKVKS